MFEKVLVANRGEIAVRVMRACEELGVGTVAVYSDPDRNAGHVRYADEAYNVGPARAAESYLDQVAILEAGRRAGADAVHPGYGFLAENAAFARRVGESELTWVGPSADAMEQLGEKTRARTAMAAADVPIVPGTTDPVDDADAVREFGAEYGYPVAIKAEGGGGGRGMKIVTGPDEAADRFESARREGEAYFDNPSVYVERYLQSPRHIEVQIVADEHGNVRHLGERDCSLQRRHQKIIEEGPSPALDAPTREAIGAAARRGVEAAGYTNAGTVEFLVPSEQAFDGEDAGEFYFLEVNTRIQVEHTVTEALTGIDIVKEQLRVAAGEPIGFSQDEVDLRGHAMEFRINAEDAADGFAPETGRLDTYDPPGGIGIRMDDALRPGDRIGGDYDSMIAKLIVHAEDREACLARSRRALAEFDVRGVRTVIPFHRHMLADEAFVAGTHTTDYLDDHLDPEAVAEAYERYGPPPAAADADADADADDEAAVTERQFVVEVNGKRFEVDLEERGAPPIPSPADVTDEGATGPSTGTGAGSRPRSTTEAGEEAADDDTPAAGGGRVSAEMQGTILSVDVEPGDVVEPGDIVCVLEAMKMENDVIADQGGTVDEVLVETGQSVDMGDVLITFE